MMRIGYVFRQKGTFVQLREIQMVEKKNRATASLKWIALAVGVAV